MLTKFSEHDNTSTMAKTPAAQHLFQINDDVTPLSNNVVVVFHTFMAKASFLTKHTCPDLATAVTFLYTCVTCLDQDNWKKLCCMMQYLHATLDLPLILHGNGTSNVNW